jgi:sortase A
MILFGIVLIGLGLLAYPTFADWWNSLHQARAIQSYAAAVANLDREEYDRIIEEAEKYNRELSRTGSVWNMQEAQIREYNYQLAIDDSGIMGYIDIPKINIKLPLYHGTDERILNIAIGHIAGTSLPVGGEGTHCVLSGHRGLPSARLFTDLDKVVEGDTWTLTVLDRTYTYECDQIRVVEPTDLSNLAMEPGKDYCTLVTCTPYGVNTHRLLVRGHRIANASGEANVIADAILIESVYIAPFIAVPMLIVLIIEMLIVTGRRRRKKAAVEALKREV